MISAKGIIVTPDVLDYIMKNAPNIGLGTVYKVFEFLYKTT